jgi:uracil-DNA glycosylase
MHPCYVAKRSSSKGGNPVPNLIVPPNAGLAELQEASKKCKNCDLYKHDTQTVFGEGPASAKVMLVGEDPGDQEDLEGHPFVGPAGKLLDTALGEAGIDDFRVTQHRGEFIESTIAPQVMATVHPSSILRAPDDETRHQEMRRFVQDLSKIPPLI